MSPDRQTTQGRRELLPQGGALRRQPGDGLGRPEHQPGRHARARDREVRAEGDGRAQAAQRLRAQARVRHAAQGAPRRPVTRAIGHAGRFVAASTIRKRASPKAPAPGPTAASRPRSTRSSSRWWATASARRCAAARLLQRPHRTGVVPATLGRRRCGAARDGARRGAARSLARPLPERPAERLRAAAGRPRPSPGSMAPGLSPLAPPTLSASATDANSTTASPSRSARWCTTPSWTKR